MFSPAPPISSKNVTGGMSTLGTLMYERRDDALIDNTLFARVHPSTSNGERQIIGQQHHANAQNVATGTRD